MAIAPFVSSAKKMRPENSLLRDLQPDKNTGLPTIPQIMSSQPDDFIKLANTLYDLGYDTVNWNLGCPFPMVVKKGRGAGLLCYPDRIESFLERTMPVIKPRLSIKLRIGLKYPDEVLPLMLIFNRFPLAELIIHPRTAGQMYTGKVDLEIFEQCLILSKHTIVYNGDIDSTQKLALLAKRFGSVKKWMIGRGLLANPFLAEEIKCHTQKSYQEKIKIMRAFHDDLFAQYAKTLSGPAHITNKMKEIWTYMGGFFVNGQKIQKKIKKMQHRDNYIDFINNVFNELVC